MLVQRSMLRFVNSMEIYLNITFNNIESKEC